jgi:hypothetical protein
LNQQAIVDHCHSQLCHWIGIRTFNHGFGCLCFHSEFKNGLLQVQDINIQRFHDMI